MKKRNKNESNSKQLRVIQAELDDLHSVGKLSVKYKVLAIEMVSGRGLVVELQCLSCGEKKKRKMAHIRYDPSKGGCICQRIHTEEEVKKLLQQKLGPQYKVNKLFRKRTTSKKAKHQKFPFHAHIYDKKWKCTHMNLNANNILNQETLPMTAKMIHYDKVRKVVESVWPTLKVKFVARPQRILKGGKKPSFHSMIFPFVRCTNCGQEYFKRFSRPKKTTRTFCCGLGGTTGKREDFIKSCKRNGGKGLLYFCYLRHPLGFEYIKQGITSKMGLERMSDFKKEDFIEVVVFRTYIGDAGTIYDIEQYLLNMKPYVKPKVKFNGSSECYEWDVIPNLCTKRDRAYIRKWRGKVRAGKTDRSWSNFIEFLEDEERHQVDLMQLKA